MIVEAGRPVRIVAIALGLAAVACAGAPPAPQPQPEPALPPAAEPAAAPTQADRPDRPAQGQAVAAAQRQPPAWLREASQLDLDGRTGEARRVLAAAADSVSDPASKAAAWRATAVSYAFDGDCAQTVKYEEMVIGYWKTREQAEPQNAFYQEGEVANEAARVCIDAGKLDEAERWYRAGTEMGNREPEPRTHPRSLWDYRLAHALGRIAARRGNSAEAARQIAAARRALDSDTAMARQQERFFPYLVGYVELYAGDASKAQTELERAVALPGNDRDPFMHTLLGMADEKLGRAAEATAEYRKALDLATAHNPPSAFTRRFVRQKLSAAGSR